MDLSPLYKTIQTRPVDDPLRKVAASASPLCLAMHMNSDIKPYDHMQYLDARLTALCDLQLYPDGPGEAPNVYLRDVEDTGDFYLHGTGYDAAIDDTAYDAAEMILCRPSYQGPPEDCPKEDRVVLKLAIAFGPRMGKSMMVTEHLPLWFLGRYPQNSVTVATYSQDFANKWGKNVQDVLEDRGERLPIASDGMPLVPRSSTLDNMSFRAGKDTGEINYRGSSGVLTGTGWGLGIIDDPFKDDTEALSPTIRERKAAWYVSSYSNRRTRRRGCPPPLEVMMFTRWHVDDLAGRFAYGEDGETPRLDWHVVRLPSLAEANDPLGRQPGESLCPQLARRDYLLSEQEKDPSWFSCMHQGVPTVQGGGLFAKTAEHLDSQNTYHHYTATAAGGFHYKGKVVQGAHVLFFITMDLATSLKTSADYTVASLWAWDSKKRVLVLVDRKRERVSSESHATWLNEFIALHPTRKLAFVGIEDKTFGTSLINELNAEPEFRHLIVPIPAKGDKYSRAVPYAEAVKAGNVWFPDPDVTTWSVSWENEHAKFPKVPHDDQVDTGSMAWTKAQDYVYHDNSPDTPEEISHVQRVRRNQRQRTGRHPYAKLQGLMHR